VWLYSFELRKFAENILLAVIKHTPMSFLQEWDPLHDLCVYARYPGYVQIYLFYPLLRKMRQFVVKHYINIQQERGVDTASRYCVWSCGMLSGVTFFWVPCVWGREVHAVWMTADANYRAGSWQIRDSRLCCMIDGVFQTFRWQPLSLLCPVSTSFS